MSDTIDPNDKPKNPLWQGGLFDNVSPYVKDALDKTQPGQTSEEYNAAHQPVILPPGTQNDPDAPQGEDDFDQALKDMLDKEAPAEQENMDPPEYSQESCPSCSGTGKVPVTENGDLVVDGPLECSQPAAPTAEQQKKIAQWKWDEEQKSVQAEINAIKKEYES